MLGHEIGLLLALFIGACDFLGEDAGDGDGGDSSGQDQGLVVEKDR